MLEIACLLQDDQGRTFLRSVQGLIGHTVARNLRKDKESNQMLMIKVRLLPGDFVCLLVCLFLCALSKG